MDWERQERLLDAAATEAGVNMGTVRRRLREQVIELPSWAVGNAGTRYGVFRDPGAARTVWDRIDDCAEIQRVVGVCPVMASHVIWDHDDSGRFEPIREYAAARGLAIGTVHPNTTAGQQFRLGSICNPLEEVRASSLAHFRDCVGIARALGSTKIGLWLSDGTNYPGQDSLRERRQRMLEGLASLYKAMDPGMMLLLEYKPFEPYYYATDMMDWGMAYLVARRLGDRAKVLVDLGHHLQGVNVEQIVGVLIDEGKLGGFHFNDHRYADDDLMTGTVNPLTLFLIFDEIVSAEADGLKPAITYMLDQSHNIEPSIEGVIQSVMNVQVAYAKALLVDRAALRRAQSVGDVILANRTLMGAFETDVRPLLARVRAEMGRAPDPIASYREGGYAQKIERDRRGTGIVTLGGPGA